MENLTEEQTKALKAFLSNDEINNLATVHGILVESFSFNVGSNGRISGGDGQQKTTINLQGRTYFGNEAQSAEIAFIQGERIPAPRYNTGTKQILIYLPIAQFAAAADVVRNSKYTLCIYTESPSIDQKQAYLHTYLQL